MKLLFCLLLTLGVFFMPSKNINQINNIQDCFNNSTTINLIIDGDFKTFNQNSKQYTNLLNQFNTLLQNSHQMPALGVSIDELTKQEIKNGVWIQFNFDRVYKNSQMPFDGLLIKIENQSYGLNLIRKYNNKYDGRCFYLNLEIDTSNFYNELLNIF